VAVRLAAAPRCSDLPALQKYDFLVLFPINPTTLAKYREAFQPSRTEDDPTDAELALDLLLCHPERFQPLKPQSPGMPQLMYQVDQGRRLVADKSRFVNRLCRALKQYYPQALGWFAQRDTRVLCDFIERWPNLLFHNLPVIPAPESGFNHGLLALSDPNQPIQACSELLSTFSFGKWMKMRFGWIFA